MKKLFLVLLSTHIFCASAQNFTDSNLPIVVFSTGGKPIDSAYGPIYVIWMGVIDNAQGRNHLGDPYTYQGLIKIKVHGNSTQWFPKKAWNVTTIDSHTKNLDTSIMRLPKEHDWVFKALYEDKTLLRDEITFRIFQQMGRYASRSRFFELVVDGNYRGVYQLEEKIKHGKNRVNIAKLKPTDTSGILLTGGYMVSIDRMKTGDQGWTSMYPSSPNNDSANIYLYDYPKPDSMPQVQKDYIHHFFDKFETVMESQHWNNPDSGYSKYINVESFVDKFLIEELSRNTDGYRLKAWYYKDRDSKGDGKIHAGPIWDYAIGWGNCSYSGGDNPWWWQYDMSYRTNFVSFYWRKLLTDPTFQDALRCRYQQLRPVVLNENNMYAHVDSMVAYLGEAEQRNFQRWPILGQNTWPEPQPVPRDYAGEISRLKWWINERLKWLDSYIPGICNSTGIAQIDKSTAVKIYPNPFSQAFRVDYTVAPKDCAGGKAQVVIELFNLLGDRVYLSWTGKEQGTYSEQVANVQLVPGIYTVKLSINNVSYSHKLVKTNE